MRGSHRAIGMASLLLAGVGMMAQMAPVCCRYTYDWPVDGQGPSGACTGDFATVCEAGSGNSSTSDPLSKVRRPGSRYALCCTYTLGGSGVFIIAPCDEPPHPDAEMIGQLADGNCCWAYDPGGMNVDCWPLQLTVMRCENSCKDNQAPQ